MLQCHMCVIAVYRTSLSMALVFYLNPEACGNDENMGDKRCQN